MTEAEQLDLYRRSSFAGRASDINGWLRKLPTFGGIWQDQRAGGAIVIALTESDPEVLRGINQRFAPYDTPTPWRLVIVPRTYEGLRDAFRRAGRVSRAIDPDAMLWSVGLDESGGVISLLYDPDDVKRMRSKKQALERPLAVAAGYDPYADPWLARQSVLTLTGYDRYSIQGVGRRSRVMSPRFV